MAILPIALLAAAAVLYGNECCTGLSPDSFHYISAAQSWTPNTNHFPPLYPWALRATHLLLGNGPASDLPIAPYLFAARWLNAALMAVNVLLLAVILRPYLRGMHFNIVPLLAVAVFALVERDLLLVHEMVWSEPLFIALTLAGVAAVMGGVRQEKFYLVAIGAVAFAGALLTRFTGATWILAAAIAIALMPGNLERRVRWTIGFGLIACLPMIAWLIDNARKHRGATDRSLVYHAIPPSAWTDGRRTFGAWIAPPALPHWTGPLLLLIFFGGLAALGVLAWGRRREWWNRAEPLPVFLIAAIAGYIGFLIFSLTFYDAQTPLDDRILSPLYVMMLLFVAGGVAKLVKLGGGGSSAAVAAVMASALFAGHAIDSASVLRQWHADGIGRYSNRAWIQSPLLHYVATQVNPRTPIYSNAADGFAVLGRSDSLIPQKFNPGNKRSNPNFAEECQRMRDVLEKRDGLLIYTKLAPRARREYTPTVEELQAIMPLRLVQTLENVEIYRIGDLATEDTERNKEGTADERR